MADNIVENLEINRESRSKLAQSSKREWAEMKQDNQYKKTPSLSKAAKKDKNAISVNRLFNK